MQSNDFSASRILFRDAQILVCLKPAGVLSEGDGMPALLAEFCRAQGEPDGIWPVHRLDRDVGGVMVYARTAEAAAALSSEVSCRRLEKEYLAVAGGVPEESAGTMRDLLFKDSSKNRSYVVRRMRKGVREAVLQYETLELSPEKDASLVRILLETGRSHQIRVQFASRQLPLLGDRKYGGRPGTGIALWAHRLRFTHPVTGETMCFSAPPPESAPWTAFSKSFQEETP